MSRKVKNEVKINGKLFSFGRFGLAKDDEGRIRGSIMVLTDEDTENTIEVGFIPQSPTYKSGKENTTYKLLEKIINEEPTIEKVGKDKAMDLRIDARMVPNIFYMSEKPGSDVLRCVESYQVQASFIHEDNRVKPRADFSIDCLFFGIEDKLTRDCEPSGNKVVKVGIIDDYRDSILHLKMELRDPDGIAFMESAYFTPQETILSLDGEVINGIVTREEKVETGFGTPKINTKEVNEKTILITSAGFPYENFVTEEELKGYEDNRKKQMAEAESRARDRLASKKATPAAFGAATSASVTVNKTKTNFDF